MFKAFSNLLRRLTGKTPPPALPRAEPDDRLTPPAPESSSFDNSRFLNFVTPPPAPLPPSPPWLTALKSVLVPAAHSKRAEPELASEYTRDVPGDLKVKSHLHITHRPRLRSIGDGLVVPGDLKIGGEFHASLTPEQKRIPLRTLPRGLRVGGSLELRHCFLLERLPDDMTVSGSILLQDCDRLTTLPDPLYVAGSLTIIGGRSLTSLPGTLQVAGDFRLAGTHITALPAGLVVGGSLTIEGRSRVATIPATIRVGGDIVLRRLPIESLPEGLQIRQTLRLQGARKLKLLPPNLTVPANLDLADCAALEKLPLRLKVGRSIKLRGCRSLQSLPAGLEVLRTLDLRGCTSLTELPHGLRIGFGLTSANLPGETSMPMSTFTPALRLADCPNLTALPDDLQLGGPIEVAGSGLVDLPPALAKSHVLWRGVLVPANVIFHPERILPLDVLRQPNAELRRVMMDRLGPGNVLRRVGAETRDQDTDAGGPRRLVFVSRLNHCYLMCQCPSTARQYLLRVPPDTRTCKQAAAWLAGFDDPSQYKPTVET